MGPQELFRDGAFWDLAKFTKERALFKVNIHAVAKTVMTLSEKSILVDAEGELGFASACLKARQRHLSHFLGESQRTERVLNFLRFGYLFFFRKFHRCLSNGFHLIFCENN